MPTFAAAAEAVLAQMRPGWRNPKHGKDWLSSMERVAFPRLGKLPVSEVTNADVVDPLRATGTSGLRRRGGSDNPSARSWSGPSHLNYLDDNPCSRIGPVLGPQQDLGLGVGDHPLPQRVAESDAGRRFGAGDGGVDGDDGDGDAGRADRLAGHRRVRAGFKADALWVGAASDLLDGPTGRLNASEAAVTRMRTALDGSRGFTLGGARLSLTPTVEVGLHRDGGDAQKGAGMDVVGLAFTDTVTRLSLDVRVRTLVVHRAEVFTDRRNLAVRSGGPLLDLRRRPHRGAREPGPLHRAHGRGSR